MTQEEAENRWRRVGTAFGIHAEREEEGLGFDTSRRHEFEYTHGAFELEFSCQTSPSLLYGFSIRNEGNHVDTYIAYDPTEGLTPPDDPGGKEYIRRFAPYMRDRPGIPPRYHDGIQEFVRLIEEGF